MSGSRSAGPDGYVEGLGVGLSVLVSSSVDSSQPSSSAHRRALPTRRATAADRVRADHRIDHSTRISGWTMRRAA
ncbi:hypothetical protein ACIQU4_17595 [Streptomyces sp. NPDC090741]|uniref:hypothetical protein n=1 Tax=Streptomyces sp. NPDC090741 TaxID=3365967 RepID=UPI00380646F4